MTRWCSEGPMRETFRTCLLISLLGLSSCLGSPGAGPTPSPPAGARTMPTTAVRMATASATVSRRDCDPSYPDCRDIPYRRFRVLRPDPHHFDSDRDGIGCES
jgi:hypothetical protein